MNKLFINDKKIIFIPVIFLAIFYLISQPWNSWFQLYDDHDITEALKFFDDKDFFQVFNIWMERDFSIIARLRITFWIERLSKIFFYGMNYKLWSLHSIFVSLLSIYIFSFTLFKRGYSNFSILIGSFCMFFGYQVNSWFRFSTSEPTGNLLLALILLIVICEFHKANLLNFLILIFLIGALAFVKESYILALPWLAFIKYGMDQKISLKSFIKNERLFLISILIIFIFTTLIVLGILKNVSGYSASYNVLNLQNVLVSLRDLLRFGNLGILFIGTLLLSLMKNNKLLFKFLLPILLIIIPQVVIHNSYSFHERYLYPIVFALSISITILVDRIIPKEGNLFKKYFSSISKLSIIGYLSTLVLIFILSTNDKFLAYNLLFLISILSISLSTFILAKNLISKSNYSLEKLKVILTKRLIILLTYSLTVSFGHSVYAINSFKYQGNVNKNFLEDNLTYCKERNNILMLVDPIRHHAWAASVSSFMEYLGGCIPDNLYLGDKPGDNTSNYLKYYYYQYSNRFPESAKYSNKYQKIIIPIYLGMDEVNNNLKRIGYDINNFEEEKEIQNFVFRSFILKNEIKEIDK